MKIISKLSTLGFMDCDPTILGTHTNSLGQLITFYEHPVWGDSVPVYAEIDGVLFNTGFYDLDDMLQDHGEYTPLLIDGEIKFKD